MHIWDKNYFRDVLKMIRFLQKNSRNRESSENSPRSGIFKPAHCSNRLKQKLEKQLLGKIYEKTEKNPTLLRNEEVKIECLLDLTQRLNMVMQRQEVPEMLKCLELFLEILYCNEYYYLTRKGLLIAVKIVFTLEEFSRCGKIVKKLLTLACRERDYSCLVSGWMRLAECQSRCSKFKPALFAYFQVLKFSIISGDLDSELKAYDKIGLVYFNLNHIEEAKFFHKKGLGQGFLTSADRKNKTMVKAILTSLFEKGTTMIHELILEEFLQLFNYTEQRDLWRSEGVLSLNADQEMTLIKYLFNFKYENQADKNSCFSQKDNSEFHFVSAEKNHVKPCRVRTEPLFHWEDSSDSDNEELQKPAKPVDNCYCHQIMFYQSKCRVCLQIQNKFRLVESQESPKKNKMAPRKRKIPKKIRRIKDRGTFGTPSLPVQVKVNPKVLNKYGESYFTAKDNHLQKKKLLKNLKSIYHNQIVRTHLSNTRNLSRIKTMALADGNLHRAILKTNLKPSRIWGISKTLLQFSRELQHVLSLIRKFTQLLD